VAVSTASSSTTALGVAATHRAPRIRARESGLSAAPVGGCGDSSSRGVPRGTLGRMTSDMDADLLGSGLDRRALLDVLRRTLEAAGMDVEADVRDLPARVADLRRQAEALPLRRALGPRGPSR